LNAFYIDLLKIVQNNVDKYVYVFVRDEIEYYVNDVVEIEIVDRVAESLRRNFNRNENTG